jgi:glycosyltransferase involved in cell wall biosynthesis
LASTPFLPADAARPVILVSPDLRASVLGVARSLVDAGLLRRFVTTLALAPSGDSGPLGRLFLRTLRKSASRQTPAWMAGQVHAYPAREVVRLAAQYLRLGSAVCDRVWEWAETGFDRRVARAWAGRAPCLYGCEHASTETFRRQRAAGGWNVLWQVIAHHRHMTRTLTAELDKFPDVAAAAARQMFRSAERVNARKDEQYALADLIVANSEFVRRTFIEAGVPADKVVAVPTGCPPVAPDAERRRRRARPGKRIFLCAGTLSIRKGTHVLLDAWRRLSFRSAAELWLVGATDLPRRLLEDLPRGVSVRPPVPRAELSQLYAQADVLVLPTLCEGRAYIILEAVAHGLPVITTEGAGCGDVVQDGVNGWVVPAGDAEALAQRLAWCLDNPEEVAAQGLASLGLARGWQVEDFSREHAAVLRQFLADRGVRPQPASCAD